MNPETESKIRTHLETATRLGAILEEVEQLKDRIIKLEAEASYLVDHDQSSNKPKRSMATSQLNKKIEKAYLELVLSDIESQILQLIWKNDGDKGLSPRQLEAELPSELFLESGRSKKSQIIETLTKMLKDGLAYRTSGNRFRAKKAVPLSLKAPNA